jgi:hypothetical protein
MAIRFFTTPGTQTKPQTKLDDSSAVFWRPNFSQLLKNGILQIRIAGSQRGLEAK